MASSSPPKDSKRHRLREPFRRGVDWVKDVFHSVSDSRSPSPGPIALPAPSAKPRDSSPTSNNNFNKPSVEPKALTMTDPGSNTRDKFKDVGSMAWAGLETALQAFIRSAEVFPPLKSAVSGFNECLGIVKAAAKNREDYHELASELRAMVGTLNQYANELGAEDMNDCIASIASSIEKEVNQIKKKQGRGGGQPLLESARDKDDVIQRYRRIEALFRQLQANIGLRTLQNTNEQLEVSKEFARSTNEQLETALIESMSPEEDARYNSAYSMTVKRRGCTAETREKVQEGLREWAQDSSSAKVYWMSGMAGTGKTTIAYSLCGWLEANKRLGASFFCSRTAASCRNVNRIIPTIVCQLARYLSAFRSALYKTLKSDRGVSKLNVVEQFEKLIKLPLLEVASELPSGVVVVIDALDECKDGYGERLMLATLMRFAAGLPVKFFLTSRPEPAIRDKLLLSRDYSPITLQLHDIEESIVEGDIKKFLTEALGSMSPPPSEDEIQQLATRAGKLFIYAATVARYILPDNVSVNSSARLNAMLETGAGSSNHAMSVKRYKELDAVYATILTAAFDESLEDEEAAVMRLVLWTFICAREPMTTKTVGTLLNLNEQQVWSMVQPLQSVLHVSESSGLVSMLHASFSDYMLDRLRSGEFHCDETQHNRLLAARCFNVMNGQLRFNICNLESSFVFDKDVPALEEQIHRSISPALFYACQYWSEHLRLAGPSDGLYNQLADFISHSLLFWMEVLNLKQCIVSGALTLLEAQDWLLENHPQPHLRQSMADAENFVARFAASGCIHSTPHIYISALPLCPKSSSLYVDYWGRTKGLLEMKGRAMTRREQAAMATWVAGSGINTVAFSPDGTRVVSDADDCIIRVWDARTSNLVQSIKAHTEPVKSVAFSRDGSRIVSGSSDHTIHIWDAQTGDLVTGPFQGHTGSVNSVTFSPDGRCIVSGSSDHTIRVWDAPTGNPATGPFEGHAGSVNCIAISPDGTHIVSGSDDCTIRVWDARTGDPVAGPFTGHVCAVFSVSFSPDSIRIISGSDDCTIRVWDAHTGRLVAEPFEGHTDALTSLSFSPDSLRIVSGSRDRTIRIWDARTGDLVSEPLEGHTDWVTSVEFSPDGTRVISGSDDCTIRVWDAYPSNLSVGPLEGHTEPVWSVAFSPDGTRIASSSYDQTIRVWNAHTGDLIAGPFEGHTDSVTSVAFSPDGSSIVSGSDDATIRLWHVHAGNLIAEPFRGHTHPVISVAFSPDGTRIVSSSEGCTIRVWHVRTGCLITGPLKGHTGWVHSVAFSPDSALVVSGSADCTIRVWDTRTGGPVVGPLEGHTDSVTSVEFSPDGSRIVSGSWDRTIRVWDARTGDLIGVPFEGHTNPIDSVAFSPDGTRIVSGSSDRTIRVWDAHKGNIVAGPFEGHTDWINSVAFSPDGTHVVSCSRDRTIRFWDVDAGVIAQPPQIQGNLALSIAPSSSHMNSHSTSSLVTHLPSPDKSDTIVLPNNNWKFHRDGWITLNDTRLFWVPADILACMPRPLNSLVIGRQGSIWVENWDLLLGNNWSKCYLYQ